ncbi:SDR family oxidoreductase [Microvirga sp. 3-52]|uniref:SDR family NAD(P)-dependent oxidoreductase n=1 Tax=Microvirga sp. 3-52 TaxID=2792425 RepID=UPI001AC39B00|nr:SDR family oxidoreductase [Microvirga sp. 3-52]MBO1908490.1 SDR family oxidoreductase [Microvirga sp. 3-52]MBS7455020.1 SDR family oxidoreductase [Microvirga sp. 3-52]
MVRTPALITGASTGIGAAYAERLAQRGHDLILVARDAMKLKQVASSIGEMTGVAIDIIPADLTSDVDRAMVEERLREDPGISILVNNAGVSSNTTILNADPDRLEDLINLNMVALTRLSVAVTPRLAAREHGAITNLSSVTALIPAAFEPTYLAAKAYVLAFSESQAAQLEPHGVRVQTVLPGMTRTEIWAKGGHDLTAMPQDMNMEVGEMVDAALAGFDLGETVTIPSLPNVGQWTAFLEARATLQPHLSLRHAARRYRVQDWKREHALDEALEATFPASDPIAVSGCHPRTP